MVDPDERVSGRGFKILIENGVEVVKFHSHKDEAKNLIEGFIKLKKEKRPFISLKLAMSLNGKIATAKNESNWISGVSARNLVHFFRSRHDAVMVGTKTALSDNPRLNLRGPFAKLKQPIRVILDRTLLLSHAGSFFQNLNTQKSILIHDRALQKEAAKKWGDSKLHLLGVKTDQQNRLDLVDLFYSLGKYGLTKVLVEGGGRLSEALVRQGLVDQIIIFSAGIILDKLSIDGLVADTSSFKNTHLCDFPRYKLESTFQIGNDVAHIWRPRV